MRSSWGVLPITLLIAAAAGCGRTGAELARSFQAEGQVISIAGDGTSVTIAHEDIQGFMPAMTMLFPVKDPAALAGIARNDLVQFELKVAPDESWVSSIHRTGRGVEQAIDASDPAAAGLLSPGDKLSEFTLFNHDGKTVHLADFEGKPLAITFIFTRCPIPEYCPRFTGNFAQVQRNLAERFPDQFQLLSISIDPDYDTAQVLREYGKRNGADFGVWSLLTGQEDEIRKIADEVGVQFFKAGGMINHTGICVLVTPDGKLHKIHRGNTWTAQEITQDLESLMSPTVAQGDTDEKAG